MYPKKYNLQFLVNAKKVRMKLPFNWYNMIATCCYIGKFPVMPGTMGSIASYPIYYFIIMHSHNISDVYNKFFIFLFLFLILGVLAIKKFQKVTNTFDHSYIVIDEIIGQLLTIMISFNCLRYIKEEIYLFAPYNLEIFIFVSSLVLFRYFDIRKPLIIGYVNNKFKGPFGVILDDILAAFAASGVVYIIYKSIFWYNQFISF